MPDLPTLPDTQAAVTLVAYALFAAAYVAKDLGQWWK